jgi:hypothetical protein
VSKWIVRAGFAALLLSSVTIKLLLGSEARPKASLEDALLNLLASRGFAYTGSTSIEHGALISMGFTAPGCDRPLHIVNTYRTFQAMALFNAVGQVGDDRIFVYLDAVLHKADRQAMFVEHAKKRALQVLGLTSYVADSHMLMISEPEGCNVVSQIGWASLWKREFRSRLASEQATLVRQN